MYGGRPLADMNNFILSPRGETMMILKTKRSDAGTYSCVLENSAGTTGTSAVTNLCNGFPLDDRLGPRALFEARGVFFLQIRITNRNVSLLPFCYYLLK